MLWKIRLSLGSDLDDVDTLECSDPARRLLVSIVSQTKLSIAIVAPTINLQKKQNHKFLKANMIYENVSFVTQNDTFSHQKGEKGHEFFLLPAAINEPLPLHCPEQP